MAQTFRGMEVEIKDKTNIHGFETYLMFIEETGD